MAEQDTVKVQVNRSWDSMCRKDLNVPFELQHTYRKWLLSLEDQANKGKPRFKEEWLPTKKGSKLKPGILLPPPYGPLWEKLVDERGSKWESKYMDYTSAKMAEATVYLTVESIRAATALIYDSKSIIEPDLRASAAKKRKKRENLEGLPEAPKTCSKALWMENRDEAQKWLESILKEWNGLEDLGVFEHNFTRAELRERGITSNPIPLTQALDYKYAKDGSVDKYKTRFPLAGHPGNMEKGIHYSESYAPTPSQNSSRLLMALMILYDLKQMTFDVAQAYCQADLPEHEKIAVRYPDGFKRKHPETGEEMFMILRKSLYGHPAAGRYWDRHRNATVLRLFNEPNSGFKARRCVREPSLVIITRGDEYAYILTHTDGCDKVGTSSKFLEEIHAILNEEWECKITDSSYMLGVERNVSEDRSEVELKMTAFIETMAASFKDEIKSKPVHTPVPENLFIHKPTKMEDVDENEKAKEIIDRGAQRLLGMLLWAARGVFPECLFGTSMLGRCMSRPTEEFWSAAVHMMNYMHQNRHRGVKFSKCGNKFPVAMVDASNKPDPTDSKCQYGYYIMYAGGPIIAVSKKLSHIGLSAAHNEYMALHWCNRHVVWLRSLLVEMGFGDIVSKPTLVRGDNQAANTLCNDDIVTTGNQFIITPYHYNKECVRQQQVEILYVQSEQNLADIQTKGVHKNVISRIGSKATGQDPYTDAESRNHSTNKNGV